MEEIWKDIEGYEGLYQVSNLGRVKSLGNNKNRKEKIIKQIKKKDGYLYLKCSKNGESKTFSVHRLVAQAFIPNPNNLPEIDHINTVPTDNRIENLRWCSRKGNMNNPITLDKITGFNHHKSKPLLQLTANNEILKIWGSSMLIEKQKGWRNAHIWECCRKKRKTYKGYKWQYVDDYLADWWEEEMEKATF